MSSESCAACKRLRAHVAEETLALLDAVSKIAMNAEIVSSIECFGADLALVFRCISGASGVHTRAQAALRLCYRRPGANLATVFMSSSHMQFHFSLVGEFSAAIVALVPCAVSAVNRRQVSLQYVHPRELLAAHFTLVAGVRVLSSAAALSMRRVVVSADR